MNIGIICYPTYGGSGIVATEMGMYLAQKGHQVHFLSYSLPARLDITLPNIHFHRVDIEPYPLFQYQPYTLALSTSIVEIALQYGLDLVHSHYAIPHAYAAYYAKQILREKKVSLPIITTLHGTDITLVGKHPTYKTAVEFSINQSDAVTTVSKSLKEDTLDMFDIQKDIEVIPNFIDIDLYNHTHIPCPRKNFATDDEKILIHVSNLRKVKRIEDVIHIFYKVQQKIPAKLIIIGEGPEQETIDNLSVELGISNSIKQLGKTQDLIPLLCMSDVFLLPSEQESFGLAALEAMAAGVPVISSNAGGLPEVNSNGKSGFTCPVGDIDTMVQKTLELLQSPETLLKFKKAAKQQAEIFDIHAIISEYETLYEKIVNQK